MADFLDLPLLTYADLQIAKQVDVQLGFQAAAHFLVSRYREVGMAVAADADVNKWISLLDRDQRPYRLSILHIDDVERLSVAVPGEILSLVGDSSIDEDDYEEEPDVLDPAATCPLCIIEAHQGAFGDHAWLEVLPATDEERLLFEDPTALMITEERVERIRRVVQLVPRSTGTRAVREGREHQ